MKPCKNLCVLILLFVSTLTADNEETLLPNTIFGISIGQHIKEIKTIYKLNKVPSENEAVKKYKIIYNDESLETFIYVFNSKVCKISLVYKQGFIDETDFENLYNQAISLYGNPLKVVTTINGNLTKETFLWEDDKIKYQFIKTTDNKKIQNFNISVIDKLTETKIANLSPFIKFYYKLINKF